MTEALHAAGFRITPLRRAVPRCLEKSEGIPAARKVAGQVFELEFCGQPTAPTAIAPGRTGA